MESTAVTVVEQPRRAPIAAGGKVMAIVPQNMEEAYRMAVALHSSGMTPYGVDTPEKVMVAIMHGLEVGLTPMMAVQNIAVVNGRPTIWGKAVLGLVLASGSLADIKEYFEGEGESRVAVCVAKRKGIPGETRRTYSVADAKTAKLWGKMNRNGSPSPWVTNPDRMLQMRARGFCLGDLFADVLGGMYLKEEIDDVIPETAVRPPLATRPEIVADAKPPAMIVNGENMAGHAEPVEEVVWTEDAVVSASAPEAATAVADAPAPVKPPAPRRPPPLPPRTAASPSMKAA